MSRPCAKVLHVSTACSIGGCEAHILALLDNLDRTRYEPWLAYFEERPDEARSMLADFHAIGVQTADLRGRGQTDPLAVLRLSRLMRREQFDIVHAHSLRAELAAVAARRLVKHPPALIRTVHNTDDFYVRRPISWLASASARQLDALIAISDAVADYIRTNTGVAPDKITRIYYGLDPAPYEGGGRKASGGRGKSRVASALRRPPPSAPIIGMVARLAPQKGHKVLLDALPAVSERFPDLCVELVGHEQQLTVDQLKAYADGRGVADNVSFTWFRDDIPDLLTRWQLLVLPSLWEGFGLVLLEAMAAGRPVVASAVGPIPEVVADGESGLLVEPGNPRALAEALLRLLEDPELAARLGETGRRRVAERFSLDRMVAETEAVYQRFLARPNFLSLSERRFPTKRLKYVACPGCGNRESVGLADEFGLGIRRCQHCDLVYVNPRLDEPQQHYHGDRDALLAKYGAILRGERGHNRDPNYREEVAVLARLKPSGKLLDVGTHCGFFLRMARGMGWELHGVEPSAAAELAREFFGLNVHRGHLEELAFPDEAFDVVTLIDVIEHVESPARLLREVRRVLKPSGVVFIKTPNARYNLFKLRLIRHRLGLDQVEIFDAKEHVVHYTRETLGQVLERAGLEVSHDFIPRPIQDGAAWKCALRSAAYRMARAQAALTGARFGPLATDLAVVASKRPMKEAA
jgi:glycosyltransferase involved in cell wall biosynthesis/2-polyprenyl-3-methyl-5-hydroxy-6-metoxy-1,4-benzoquinol methylase